MKRAVRRHHEARVKDKFRKVVKINRLKHQPVTAQKLMDEEKEAVQMAHHPAHFCEICREQIKEHEHKLQFEAEKKAPLEDE